MAAPQIKGVSEHAEFYPLLSDELLAELAEDIKANGLRQPIVLNSDGVLLDGRNRLKACQQAGVEPRFTVFDGEDEGAFVRSSNERRHQSTGSRAMSTALSLVADGLRKNGRWAYGAANSPDPGSSKNWGERLRESGLILDELPHLAQAVVDGTTALDDAYRQAKKRREAREAEERAKVEEARDEQRREDQAGNYFQNHPEAQAWLNSKPQGAFDTMRGAYAAYMEHDREARRIEAERKRKEEQEARDHREFIERHKTYAETFVQAFDFGLDMATLSVRQEVLDAMEERYRDRFLEIEETYLKKAA